MRTAEVSRRVCLSFLVGLYLLVSIVTPARAIIPAGFYAGTIIRGIIAGATTRAAIPAAGNAAKALSASGLFGVSAAAYIVMCGQNYVSGNDCSGTPLAKLRPSGVTSIDGETGAVAVPATQTTTTYQRLWIVKQLTAGTGLWYDWAGGAGFDKACQEAGYQQNRRDSLGPTRTLSNFRGAYTELGQAYQYDCRFTVVENGVTSQTNHANTLQQQYGCPTTGSPSGGTYDGNNCVGGTTYTCPSGYTLVGTTCQPNGGTMWQSDGVPSYRNQSGAWIADPNDPDTAAPLANPVIETTTAPDGQPMKVEITANPDGSVRMRTFTQTQASGQTATSVNDITISSGGTPSAITNIYYGDVSTVYNQTAPTVQTPAPAVEIPTDYARDATVQQTNTKLQTIITDGLKVKEQGVPATEGLDAGKTAYQDAAKAREDALPNITSPTGKQTSWAWNLALPTGCSSLQVDMRVGTIGQIVTLDPCAYQATIHELVSMAWAATTLFLVFGMVGRTLREV